MKALTICQPWAWAIIHGKKRIENRTWPTHYRGPLLIHAGKSRSWLCDRLNDGTAVPNKHLIFGAIIGHVELMDCIHLSKAGALQRDPFCEGPWLWIMEKPRALGPIIYRGQQGLFDVPDAVLSGSANRDAETPGLFDVGRADIPP